MTKFEDLNEQSYPNLKRLDANRFGYISELYGGRGRINVGTLSDPLGVWELY